MSDTRKDERTDLSLKVRFKSANLDEFVEHYSTDISRGGLFIKSKKPMAVGTLLKFEFQLKDQSRLIHGVGRVAWTRGEDVASDNAPPGMGIKFIKMDAESRDLVHNIVERRGEQPGRYDEGDPAQAQTSASFFPDGPPAELPAHEDRTNVRHAADFLASALAAGNADKTAAEEAAASAEAARRRGLEIQARREAEAKAGLAGGAGIPPTMAPSDGGFDDEDEATVVANREMLTSDVAALMRGSLPPEQPAKREGAAEGVVIAPEPVAPRKPVSQDRPAPQPIAPAPISSPPESEGNTGMIVGVLAALLVVGGAVWYFGIRQEPTPPVTTPVAVEPSEDPTVAPEVPEVPVVVDAGAVVAAPVEEPPAVPVPTHDVSFTTVPPGAVVRVNGEERGTSPVSVALPIGQEVVVTLKAPGFAEASRTITATATTGAQRISLTRLTYVLKVETNAPNPAIGALRRTANAAGEIELPTVPPAFQVAVMADGFTRATRDLRAADFVEENGAMRLTVQVPLTPTRAPVRPTRVGPAEDPSSVPLPTPTMIASPAGDPEPTPTPEPAADPAPAPAPDPAPAPAPAPAGE